MSAPLTSPPGSVSPGPGNVPGPTTGPAKVSSYYDGNKWVSAPQGSSGFFFDTKTQTYKSWDTVPAINPGQDFNQIRDTNARSGLNWSPSEPGDMSLRYQRNQALEEENRQKLYASGQLTPGVTAGFEREKVNLATYGVGEPTFGAAVSSTQAQNTVNGLGSIARDGLKTTTQQMGDIPRPGYDLYQNFMGSSSDPSYKMYTDLPQTIDDARRAQLDLLKGQENNIQADYGSQGTMQASENRMEMGRAMKNLARIGALGNSASGLSYIQSVDWMNQERMAKLLVSKQTALLQAMQAYQANDYKLLAAKIAESHAVTNQFNEVQQWKMDDAMKTNDQIMEQARFGWDREDRASKRLSDVINNTDDWSLADKQFIVDHEAQAGLPQGWTFGAWQIAKKQRAAKTKQEAATAERDIYAMLATVPEGRTVKIGDATYTGFKKDSTFGIYTSTQTDDEGHVTLISYNPNNGKIMKETIGKVGPSRDGWKTVEGADGLYSVNATTKAAVPIVTKGGEIDPSLQPGFYQWADSLGTITTHFGDSTGYERIHPGWDIAGKPGTPITPFVPGEVVSVDKVGLGGFGKFVEIKDAEGKIHRYSHLEYPSVEVGDYVDAGTMLGAMGNTGSVETKQGTGEYHKPDDKERAAGAGTHLDYRVYRNPQQVQTASAVKKSQPVAGMTATDINRVNTDMARVSAETDLKKRAELYKQVRANIGTAGKPALDWFENAYPPNEFIPKSETAAKEDAISGDEMQKMAEDMKKVREGNTSVERGKLYDQVRDRVVPQGEKATAQFDKAFPRSEIVGKDSTDSGFSKMTVDQRNALSKEQVIDIATRDKVGFKQLQALLTPKDGKPFENFDATDIVDFAKATGETYDALKSYLTKGGIPFIDDWFDAWTQEIEDYAKQVYNTK